MVILEDKSLDFIMEAAKKVSDVVGSTLGPYGRTVLIESKSHTKGLHVTKDGVTVAKNIALESPVERMVASIMKEASEEVVKKAGDATTSSIVLTYRLMELFQQAVKETKMNPNILLKEIKKISEEMISTVEAMAIPATPDIIEKVATISANNDETLGKLVYDCYAEVGDDAAVIVENGPATYYEVKRGFEIQGGMPNVFFANDQSDETFNAEDAHVFVYDGTIDNIFKIENVLKSKDWMRESLVIISDFSVNFAGVMATNVQRKGYKICLVNAPALGWRRQEILQDVCMATGATYYSEKMGEDLSHLTEEDLGLIASIKATTTTTAIIPPPSTREKCIERAKELRSASNVEDINHVNRRIAALDGGLGIIYVGGSSKTEQKELFDRIEDAVLAVRAARQGGVVPGGGIALFDSFDDDWPQGSTERVQACSIMEDLSYTVINRIFKNAGINRHVDEPFSNVNFGGGKGVNLITLEEGNMIDVGVIDTATAVTSSLRAAVSVASTLLSTNAIIYKP